VGRIIVGISGILLILLSLTGVVIWWRGRRALKRGLTVRWKASPKRLNYDLHGAVGIYSMIGLIILGFTGAGLTFYGAFDRTAHAIGRAGPPLEAPRSTVVAAASDISLDELVDAAVPEMPGGRLARVDFPFGEDGAFRVRFRMPGELHPIGLSMVFVDRYSGEVLLSANALDQPAARRLGYTYYPLHIGSFGGRFVQLLYVLAGLAPALLSVTGVVIWYNRRQKRNRRRATQASAMAGVRRAVRPNPPPEISSKETASKR
jgi:uncharacterized iron-regulated membrane protein